LGIKFPPPFHKEDDILSPQIFYPKATFFLSTNLAPFNHMITFSPFLFLPEETLAVSIHLLKEGLLKKKLGHRVIQRSRNTSINKDLFATRGGRITNPGI
jgi:hypothetical protein